MLINLDKRIEELKRLIKEKTHALARVVWPKELDYLLNHKELKARERKEDTKC